MSESVIARSFAGGELSPALAARADVAKYQTGAATIRNFQVDRHGGVSNRAGTRFIAECKTTDFDVILLRYVSEDQDASVVIEMGEGYFRFYQGRARVILDASTIAAYAGGTAYVPGDLAASGGELYYCTAATTGNAPPNVAFWHLQEDAIYEVPHPFQTPTDVAWVQSGRILTLTHKSVPPQDLVYSSLTRWVLAGVTTTPKVTAPVGVAITGTTPGALTYTYRVTAAAPDSYEESEPSAPIVVAGVAAPTVGAPHVISWTPKLVPLLTGVAAPEYYVYCDPFVNGTFGFIGTATGLASLRNPGFTPDYQQTPPLPRLLFDALGEYPRTCAYHQQRRYLAGPSDQPDGVFASRVGFPDNFGITSPLQDDDAITFRIAGNNHHAVRHLVALKDLLIMTEGGEWRLTSPDGVISPNSLVLDQETYVGVSGVRPVVVGNSVIYVQSRNSIVRDLQQNVEVEGLAGRDLTVFASHLFDGFTVRSMDYAQAPNSIVWVVRSDGALLGLTYVREQDIWAWHRHDTSGGSFRTVCVVPSDGEDEAYFIVRRTIGTVTRYYIEMLERRTILNFNTDSFFLDSGLTYSGAPISSALGLDHLEGKTVAILGDGLYQGTRVVTGGAVTLYVPATTVHVGLAITADLETLDLDAPGTAVRDKQKMVTALSLILEGSSRVFYAGPSVTQLVQFTRGSSDSTASAFSGQVEIGLPTNFRRAGRVFVRHTQPLPLTILATIPVMELS